MRNLLFVASCLALLCAGCQSSTPLRNPDSLDNATRQTWAVTTDFASGLHHAYDQEPESVADFGIMSRGPIPVLTSVVAVSKSSPPVTCSLSARDISKLRRATAGGLTLVLYGDGIACLSPVIKKTLVHDLQGQDNTRKEYFRLLNAQAEPALKWTRSVLGHR